MAKKRQYTFRTYSATELKNVADIPSQSEIDVGTNYIDVFNIDGSEIKNVVQNSNSFTTLYTSNNINVYAAFSPYKRSLMNQGQYGYIHSYLPTTNINTSDFAGYNHNAPSIGWEGGTAPSGTIYYDEQGYAAFSCSVNIGEFRTDNVVEGIVSATLVIWHGSNVIATDTVMLSTVKDTIGFDVQVPINQSATLTGAVFLTSTTSTFSLSDIYCKFPNTSSFSVSAQPVESNYVGASAIDIGVNGNFELLDGAGLCEVGDYRIYMTIFATMAGYSQGQQFSINYRIKKNSVNVGSGNITLQHNTTVSNIQVNMSSAAYADDVIEVELNY